MDMLLQNVVATILHIFINVSNNNVKAVAHTANYHLNLQLPSASWSFKVSFSSLLCRLTHKLLFWFWFILTALIASFSGAHSGAFSS